MSKSIVLFAALALDLALLPATGRSVSDAVKNSTPAPAVAKPDGDTGSQDPTGFPRPGGLIRNSYSVSNGTSRTTETATYHAKAELAEVAALYLEATKTAGWTEGAHSDSGAGFNLVRIIDWTMPAKEAEVRFYPAKAGGTDLWVRVFTYKASPSARSAATGTLGATNSPAAAQVGAAHSKQTGAAPLGPPPTNITVVCDGDAASHLISWQAANWASFDIYREQNGTRIQIGAEVKDTSVHESALVPPNTKYRVDVKHTDGSIGSAEYVWANPPQPGAVTGLTAVQSGPGKVVVRWKAPPYATNFRVFITTGKPEGVLETGNSSLLINVPVGRATVRVAPSYTTTDGEELRYGNAWTDVTVWGEQFRVVFLGVECVHETLDNPFQTDGKKDEIFAGAYVGTIDPYVNILNTTTPSHVGPGPGGSASSQPSHLQSEQQRRDGTTSGSAGGINRLKADANQWMMPTQLQSLRTKVMGDTNGFPDRIQAGTASDKGGIQTGDFVPSSAIINAQPGIAATADHFPLLVWEGDLTPQSKYLEIAPVIFEWDDPADPYWQAWCEWWTSPRGTQELGKNSKSVGNGLFYPFAGSIEGTDNDGKKISMYSGTVFPADKTRPVGLTFFSGNAFTNLEAIYQPRGLILTRSNVEAALGDKSAVVVKAEFNDDDGPAVDNKLQGKYTLYIQIERVLPPATQAVVH